MFICSDHMVHSWEFQFKNNIQDGKKKKDFIEPWKHVYKINWTKIIKSVQNIYTMNDIIQKQSGCCIGQYFGIVFD